MRKIENAFVSIGIRNAHAFQQNTQNGPMSLRIIHLKAVKPIHLDEMNW